MRYPIRSLYVEIRRREKYPGGKIFVVGGDINENVGKVTHGIHQPLVPEKYVGKRSYYTHGIQRMSRAVCRRINPIYKPVGLDNARIRSDNSACRVF